MKELSDKGLKLSNTEQKNILDLYKNTGIDFRNVNLGMVNFDQKFRRSYNRDTYSLSFMSYQGNQDLTGYMQNMSIAGLLLDQNQNIIMDAEKFDQFVSKDCSVSDFVNNFTDDYFRGFGKKNLGFVYDFDDKINNLLMWISWENGEDIVDNIRTKDDFNNNLDAKYKNMKLFDFVNLYNEYAVKNSEYILDRNEFTLSTEELINLYGQDSEVLQIYYLYLVDKWEKGEINRANNPTNFDFIDTFSGVAELNVEITSIDEALNLLSMDVAQTLRSNILAQIEKLWKSHPNQIGITNEQQYLQREYQFKNTIYNLDDLQILLDKLESIENQFRQEKFLHNQLPDFISKLQTSLQNQGVDGKKRLNLQSTNILNFLMLLEKSFSSNILNNPNISEKIIKLKTLVSDLDNISQDLLDEGIKNIMETLTWLKDQLQIEVNTDIDMSIFQIGQDAIENYDNEVVKRDDFSSPELNLSIGSDNLLDLYNFCDEPYDPNKTNLFRLASPKNNFKVKYRGVYEKEKQSNGIGTFLSQDKGFYLEDYAEPEYGEVFLDPKKYSDYLSLNYKDDYRKFIRSINSNGSKARYIMFLYYMRQWKFGLISPTQNQNEFLFMQGYINYDTEEINFIWTDRNAKYLRKQPMTDNYLSLMQDDLIDINMMTADEFINISRQWLANKTMFNQQKEAIRKDQFFSNKKYKVTTGSVLIYQQSFVRDRISYFQRKLRNITDEDRLEKISDDLNSMDDYITMVMENKINSMTDLSIIINSGSRDRLTLSDELLDNDQLNIFIEFEIYPNLEKILDGNFSEADLLNFKDKAEKLINGNYNIREHYDPANPWSFLRLLRSEQEGVQASFGHFEDFYNAVGNWGQDQTQRISYFVKPHFLDIDPPFSEAKNMRAVVFNKFGNGTYENTLTRDLVPYDFLEAQKEETIHNMSGILSLDVNGQTVIPLPDNAIVSAIEIQGDNFNSTNQNLKIDYGSGLIYLDVPSQSNQSVSVNMSFFVGDKNNYPSYFENFTLNNDDYPENTSLLTENMMTKVKANLAKIGFDENSNDFVKANKLKKYIIDNSAYGGAEYIDEFYYTDGTNFFEQLEVRRFGNLMIMDCDQANLYFVALCKYFGINARLVGGFSNITKVGGQGHGWAEIYFAGEWQEFDVTPRKVKPKDHIDINNDVLLTMKSTKIKGLQNYLIDNFSGYLKKMYVMKLSWEDIYQNGKFLEISEIISKIPKNELSTNTGAFVQGLTNILDMLTEGSQNYGDIFSQ